MNRYYMDRLVKGIGEAGWDAMLLSPGEELNFLMDFNPTFCERFQGLFVKKDGTMFYICNLLYAGEFRKLLPEEIEIYPWFDGEVMTEVVGRVLHEQKLDGALIGVNSTAQGFNILEIMDKVDVTFKNGKPLLENIRAVKNAQELQYLRESAAIADEVFYETVKFIKRGMTEKEIGDFMSASARIPATPTMPEPTAWCRNGISCCWISAVSGRDCTPIPPGPSLWASPRSISGKSMTW